MHKVGPAQKSLHIGNLKCPKELCKLLFNFLVCLFILSVHIYHIVYEAHYASGIGTNNYSTVI